MPDWFQSVVWSRTVSLLIAIVYLVVACLSARSAANVFLSILIVGGALLFPLACIWFADELGEYVGVLPARLSTAGHPHGWLNWAAGYYFYYPRYSFSLLTEADTRSKEIMQA